MRTSARDRDPAGRPNGPRSRVPALGRGMLRPTVAYLALSILAVAASYGWLALSESAEPSEAASAMVDSLVPVGLVSLAVIVVLFFPAMVISVELVRRAGATRLARSLGCALTWGGWLAFIAVDGAVLSHLFMRLDWIFMLTVVVAAGGAGYAAIAFRGSEARAGWGAITLAVACLALILIGSAWMAGRWGGAA